MVDFLMSFKFLDLYDANNCNERLCICRQWQDIFAGKLVACP